MPKSRRGRGGSLRSAPTGASPGGPAVGGSERWQAPKRAAPTAAQRGEARRCALKGARLLAQGRSAQAIPMFKRSIEIDPGVAATHHNLGVALLSAGRMKPAIEPFAAAVRLDPTLASSHFHLAQIFDNLGRLDEALEAYRAMVALRVDLAGPQLRLGQLYLLRGRRVESAAAFRAASAAAGGTVWAHIAEAGALNALGAFDSALMTMRAAVEAYPQSAEAHSSFGLLLGQAGISAEAAAHHLRATELSPDMFVSWSGLATNKKFTAADGPVIARMNAALARPNLTARNRQSLHFALGKAHDDMGDYEAAMRNFEAGNSIRALAGRLDRSAFARRIDQLIEETPPGYRDRHFDRGVDDATPILIVGLPRSGSTLIEQILTSHPEVAGSGELEFWPSRNCSKQGYLEHRRFRRGDATAGGRLFGDAAVVWAGRETCHRQDARQFREARLPSSSFPQRELSSTAGVIRLTPHCRSSPRISRRISFMPRIEATSCSSSDSASD